VAEGLGKLGKSGIEPSTFCLVAQLNQLRYHMPLIPQCNEAKYFTLMFMSADSYVHIPGCQNILLLKTHLMQ
jgi:hypothetical protein